MTFLRLAHMLSCSCRAVSSPSLCRRYASSQKSEGLMNVFDRKAKRLQRDRTTLLPDYQVYEYIKEEVGFRISDRIADINRQFNTMVELGCGRGYVSRHVLKETAKTIYQCELSEKLLLQSEVSPEVPTYRIVADEEFFPFKDNSLDLVVSSLSLHWVNDLPGCFRQVYNSLKNDGVFLGCMFGGDTLFELRVSLQQAEIEREGGFGAHVSPFTEVRDLGNLLNRAGYTMLTIDIDDIVITYPSMIELMQDLKGMGENNCAWTRKPMLHRDTITAASAIYKELKQCPRCQVFLKSIQHLSLEMYGNDEGVPATYQVIYFIGWKPDPSQAKAAARGSGQVSLKDLARLDELSKELQDIRDKNKPPRDDS